MPELYNTKLVVAIFVHDTGSSSVYIVELKPGLILLEKENKKR